jgi:hypothetical protein
MNLKRPVWWYFLKAGLTAFHLVSLLQTKGTKLEFFLRGFELHDHAL